MNYVIILSMTISIATLTVMGIDRYYAVKNPIKSRASR